MFNYMYHNTVTGHNYTCSVQLNCSCILHVVAEYAVVVESCTCTLLLELYVHCTVFTAGGVLYVHCTAVVSWNSTLYMYVVRHEWYGCLLETFCKQNKPR